MTLPKSLKITRDGLSDFRTLIKQLSDSEVLVGFPEGPDRPDEGVPITNASLAYIHDNGAPESNIPARPFMIPGIQQAQEKVERALSLAAKALLSSGDPSAVTKGLTRAGLAATTSIKRVVSSGVPPPLKDATLRARLRRHKGRKAEKAELARRADGEAPGIDLVKPLIDTGELYRAVTFVIRSRRKRG